MAPSTAICTLTTIAPCDLRTSRLIANLVTSAVDTDTMDIDRVADLQTALFESFIDLVESVDSDGRRGHRQPDHRCD